MLTILVLVRNTRGLAASCVQSLLESVAALGLAKGQVEYVLIDDFSDPSAGVVAMFREVRAAAAPSDVRIIRFKSHRHYAYGMALGLSLARGAAVLFISHDMVVTPACIKTLLEVAASDATIGIVRPISTHMDCARHTELAPPARTPLRDGGDVAAFSKMVARLRGLETDYPLLLVGDAMLIRRAVIDRIGVFDTRFFGFMADIDYGFRARRAGWRAVTALGAWLYHQGGGFRKSTIATSGAEAEAELARQNMLDTAAAWAVLRRKWAAASLPETFQQLDGPHVARLAALPPDAVDHQPPIAIDREVCEVF